MNVQTDAVADPTTQVKAIFEKETWSHQDCRELYALLFAMSAGAEKFRALAGELLAANPNPTGTTAVKVGMAQYMLGQFEQGFKSLGAGTENRDRRWYQALCCRNLAQYDRAIEEFARAGDRGWDQAQVQLATAECQCLAGNLDAAVKAVDKLSDLSELSDYHILRGMVCQAQGLYEQAEEAYGEALDLNPKSPAAAFRLAFLYDTQGDDEQALELYEQCLRTPPINANALINLSVLYEDAGQWDRAEECLSTVLSVQSNHPRARLYTRDVTSSRTMYYDEDLERRTVQRNAVLDIPVTDFELSVRARNCPKKMSIRCLGDLLLVTEADLLGSKNFGETSLDEIKIMLSQKGLALGQDVEVVPTAIEPAGIDGQAAISNEGVLSTPVAEMQLSVRCRKALERLGIATLGELAARTEAELLTCKNFGHTSLSEIKQRLGEFGFGLQER